jgi:hypothetical protein
MLGIQDLGNGNWVIAEFIHNTISTDEFEFDDDGNTILPEGYEGMKVIGLEGGYAETEELVYQDHDLVNFSKSDIDSALEYCKYKEWDRVDGFEKAWNALVSKVSSA